MVADQRCNAYKRDFLAAADHVRRWRELRFTTEASDLGEIAVRLGWERHPEQTLSVARSMYLRLPARAKLWLKAREFVDADRGMLAGALDGQSIIGSS